MHACCAVLYRILRDRQCSSLIVGLTGNSVAEDILYFKKQVGNSSLIEGML